MSSVAGGTEVDALCAALHTESRGWWALFAGGAGGDALCATLYAEGCGGWAQFRGFEISIMAVFLLQSATPNPEPTACSTVFQVVIMGTVIDISRWFPIIDAATCRMRSTDVATWRYGGSEARYRCSDMEVWRFGGALQV